MVSYFIMTFMEGMQMVKFLTQHTNHKKFFSELRENEIFMYDYHDFTKEEVLKAAEKYKVKVEYIERGTDDYKKYGECALRVINVEEGIYEYEISSGESIKIRAKNEQSARLKLMQYLFDKNYINLKEAK